MSNSIHYQQNKSIDSSNSSKNTAEMLHSLADTCLILAYGKFQIPLEIHTLLHKVQHILQHTQQTMQCSTSTITSPSVNEKPQKPQHWQHFTITPPRAYFNFNRKGNIHFPLIDWESFRGFSVALWIRTNIRFTHSESDTKRSFFTLYHFSNKSNTLCVKAILYWKNGDVQRKYYVSVTSEDAVLDTDVKKNFAASRAVESNVSLRNQTWHLIVLSHDSRYVKKSTVSCYVDGEKQFREDLIYSNLETAVKGYCGAGDHANGAIEIASITMLAEAIDQEQVEMLYRQGPSRSCLRRGRGYYKDVGRSIVSSFQEAIPRPSELCMHSKQRLETLASLGNARIIFNFSPEHSRAETKDHTLTTEWVQEGFVKDSRCRWVTMESLNSVSSNTSSTMSNRSRTSTTTASIVNTSSAEIQQRHAKLHDVQCVVLPDIYTAWYRTLGVNYIPILLHNVLLGYGRIGDQCKTTELDICMEKIYVHAMYALSALLCDNSDNQHSFLREHGFHMICHVLKQHKAHVSRLWFTELCISSMFELLQVLKQLNWSRERIATNIWQSNPLLALALGVWVLDCELWRYNVSYTTQAYFYQHLVAFATQCPNVMLQIGSVDKLCAILQKESSVSPDISDKAHYKDCIDAIMRIIELILQTHTVSVDPMTKEEIYSSKQSTFTLDRHSATKRSDRANKHSVSGTISCFEVFELDLEGILWSDDPIEPSKHERKRRDSHHEDARESMEATIATRAKTFRLRMSLIRDLRLVLRLFLTCDHALIQQSLLNIWQRLLPQHEDVCFALLCSNFVDSLLFTLERPTICEEMEANAPLRLSIISLLLYFIQWLESVHGRTIWCAMEERALQYLSRHANELDTASHDPHQAHLREIYLDITRCFGMRRNILFNSLEAGRKKSSLFPIQPERRLSDSASYTNASFHHIDFSNSYKDSSKQPTQTQRLVLSWERRLALVLYSAYQSVEARSSKSDTEQLQAYVAAMIAFMENLPMYSTFPFLPLLLHAVQSAERDTVLLKLSIILKINEQAQQQLLSLGSTWATTMLRLYVCAWNTEVIDCESSGIGNMRAGEALVMDAIVILLFASMQVPHGWRAVMELVHALQRFHPPKNAYAEIIQTPKQWIARVIGCIFHRFARNSTILSRTSAENVYQTLVLVERSLLDVQDSSTASQQRLLCAILELCARLTESTQKLHRIGLGPGIRMLFRSLHTLVRDDAILARVVQVLDEALKMEASVLSAVRVYDDLHPRNVLLFGLSCLRRAVRTASPRGLALLYPFIIQLANSGVFVEEFQALHDSVYAEDTSEQMLAQTALRVLSAGMDKAIAPKESEALVDGQMDTYVTAIRELNEPLTNCALPNSLSDYGTRSWNALFGDSYGDIADAAWYIELASMQSWMCKLHTRVEDIQREQRRTEMPRKYAWTHAGWLKMEYTSRSLHLEANAATRDLLRKLQQRISYRLSVRETPMPSRMRTMLEVTLDSLDALQASALDQKIEAKRRTSSKNSLKEQLVLAFGASVDPTLAVNPFYGRSASSPCKKQMNLDVMQHIRRIVTEQQEKGNESELSHASEPAETHNMEQEPIIPLRFHFHLNTMDAGYDPGEGIQFTNHHHVLLKASCHRVIPEGIVPGQLVFCTRHLLFVPDQILARNIGSRREDMQSFAPSQKDTFANGLRRIWKWKYRHIASVFLRRYRLRNSAFELFFRDGNAHFFDFPPTKSRSHSKRNDVLRLLYPFLPRQTPKEYADRPCVPLCTARKAWKAWQLSNFDYLMILNTYAGRSYNDLTQYPIFPWIISDYECANLDLTSDADTRMYRDLSKPVGALNTERLREYWDRYNAFDDPVIPKFLYGSHYSTFAGVVLFFLFRLQPFANLHRQVQGGSFDLPDRLFTSIPETWAMCNSQMSEVKELTPEFYTSPALFLRNLNHYNLGIRHDKVEIGDVKLPNWADASPERFIRIHRKALEGERVSQELCRWIDLIFGYQQRGKAALEAENVFYYLTYQSVHEAEKPMDPLAREAMELQIAHFGQCPIQLFLEPHGEKQLWLDIAQRDVYAGNGTRLGPPLFKASVSSSSCSFADADERDAACPRRHSIAAVGGQEGGNTVHSISEPTPSAEDIWVIYKATMMSNIRYLKILPDCILAVDELGIVQLFQWHVLQRELAHDKKPFYRDYPHAQSSDAQTKRAPVAALPSNTPKSEPLQSKMAEKSSEVAWTLHLENVSLTGDIASRVPYFDSIGIQSSTSTVYQKAAPIVSSLNGRLVITSGAENGTIYLRLLDLSTGHLIAKASVYGHDDVITCFALDCMYPHAASSSLHTVTPTHQLQFDQEFLVSGSRDGTLAFWKISNIKQDLMFRIPKISVNPIMLFRGHREPIIDCDLSTCAGFVVSCTLLRGIVQYLHENGQVAFTFEPVQASKNEHSISELCIVRASAKGFVCAVTKHMDCSVEIAVRSSVCVIYDVAGNLHHTHDLADSEITGLKISGDGGLAVFSLSTQVILILNLEDFSIVQEYTSVHDPSSYITCCAVGPHETLSILACGINGGTLAVRQLSEACKAVSLSSGMPRLLGANTKLKLVKGTVQHAQSFALNTIDTAKAATSTARDIAGEALGEAKTMVKGFFSKWNATKQS